MFYRKNENNFLRGYYIFLCLPPYNSDFQYFKIKLLVPRSPLDISFTCPRHMFYRKKKKNLGGGGGGGYYIFLRLPPYNSDFQYSKIKPLVPRT